MSHMRLLASHKRLLSRPHEAQEALGAHAPTSCYRSLRYRNLALAGCQDMRHDEVMSKRKTVAEEGKVASLEHSAGMNSDIHNEADRETVDQLVDAAMVSDGVFVGRQDFDHVSAEDENALNDAI